MRPELSLGSWAIRTRGSPSPALPVNGGGFPRRNWRRVERYRLTDLAKRVS